MERPSLKEIGSCLIPIGLYRREVRDVDWSFQGYKPFKELFVEPRSRCRLDHYGNDGEGWDDAWYEDYAYPMEEEARELISSKFGEEILNKLYLEVGEKGFISIHYKEDIVKND